MRPAFGPNVKKALEAFRLYMERAIVKHAAKKT
jgi:hypothetical protein